MFQQTYLDSFILSLLEKLCQEHEVTGAKAKLLIDRIDIGQLINESCFVESANEDSFENDYKALHEIGMQDVWNVIRHSKQLTKLDEFLHFYLKLSQNNNLSVEQMSASCSNLKDSFQIDRNASSGYNSQRDFSEDCSVFSLEGPVQPAIKQRKISQNDPPDNRSLVRCNDPLPMRCLFQDLSLVFQGLDAYYFKWDFTQERYLLKQNDFLTPLSVRLLNCLAAIGAIYRFFKAGFKNGHRPTMQGIQIVSTKLRLCVSDGRIAEEIDSFQNNDNFKLRSYVLAIHPQFKQSQIVRSVLDSISQFVESQYAGRLENIQNVMREYETIFPALLSDFTGNGTKKYEVNVLVCLRLMSEIKSDRSFLVALIKIRSAICQLKGIGVLEMLFRNRLHADPMIASLSCRLFKAGLITLLNLLRSFILTELDIQLLESLSLDLDFYDFKNGVIFEHKLPSFIDSGFVRAVQNLANAFRFIRSFEVDETLSYNCYKRAQNELLFEPKREIDFMHDSSCYDATNLLEDVTEFNSRVWELEKVLRNDLSDIVISKLALVKHVEFIFDFVLGLQSDFLYAFIEKASLHSGDSVEGEILLSKVLSENRFWVVKNYESQMINRLAVKQLGEQELFFYCKCSKLTLTYLLDDSPLCCVLSPRVMQQIGCLHSYISALQLQHQELVAHFGRLKVYAYLIKFSEARAVLMRLYLLLSNMTKLLNRIVRYVMHECIERSLKQIVRFLEARNWSSLQEIEWFISDSLDEAAHRCLFSRAQRPLERFCTGTELKPTYASVFSRDCTNANCVRALLQTVARALNLLGVIHESASEYVKAAYACANPQPPLVNKDMQAFENIFHEEITLLFEQYKTALGAYINLSTTYCPAFF